MRFKTKEGVYMQAIQVQDYNQAEIKTVLPACEFKGVGRNTVVDVPTAKGGRTATVGDYIIYGGRGIPNAVISEEAAQVFFEPAPAKKKAMLSQPMRGISDKEIADTRARAISYLESQGYEIVNTLFTDEWYSKSSMENRGVRQIPICFLAKSIENMSKCDAAFFCDGWETARGCRIEHQVAKAYGIEIIYETTPDTTSYDVTYMKFSRDKWDEFVKFTDGMARNMQIEKHPGGSCTCNFLTNVGVFTVYEGDIIIKGSDGYLYHVAKNSDVPTRIVPKGENDNG